MKKYLALTIIVLSLSFSFSATAAVSVTADTLTRDLTVGSSGNDVSVLQTLLETDGYLQLPAGISKGYFGDLTRRALARWQAAHGISPASGNFGPLTRQALRKKTVPVVSSSVPGCPVGALYNYYTGVPCLISDPGTDYLLPKPIVNTDVLTVQGRMLDQLTGKPVANVQFRPTNTKTDFPIFYSNSLGMFSYGIAQFTGGDKNYFDPVIIPYSSSCYEQNTLTVNKDTNDSRLGSDAYGASVQKYNSLETIKVSGPGPILNIGDIPLWPAVDIMINSDIPVSFSLYYNYLGIESGGGGNILFKNAHKLSASIPLTYDVRVVLTDTNGRTYISPFIKLPVSNGCTPVTLNFTNGQMTWQQGNDQDTAPFIAQFGLGITAGKIGEETAIYGNNLFATTKVIFTGGVQSASVRTFGGDRIIVVVPPGAQSGPITVCNNNACTVTKESFTVVTPLPLSASVRVLSPNGGETLRMGTLVTVTYTLNNWDNTPILVYLEKYHDATSIKAGQPNSISLIGETQNKTDFTFTVGGDTTQWLGTGSTFKIKVCNSFGCTVGDSSDSYFSIN
jgi:peptidoglycan hydrolase-like protein with peptidoglycan-binding domain